MKKNVLKFSVLMLLFLGVMVSSCKKEEVVTGEALFSYVADGFVVTFTNTSTVTGDVTYTWDFGDTETSTEKDPVHTYAAKGEYNVTLTVKDAKGATHPISSKIVVDRKAAVNLSDDSFDDWDAVTAEGFVINLGDFSGAMKAAKMDYDAEFIYFYAEFEGDASNLYQYDMMFDYDNSATTGATSWIWPGSGADYLVEIPEFTGDSLTIFTFDYIGADGEDEWEWEEQELLANAVVVGKIGQKGDNIAIEVGFDRAKLPNMAGNEISFGLFVSDADWADIAYAPDMADAEGNPEQQMFKFIME